MSFPTSIDVLVVVILVVPFSYKLGIVCCNNFTRFTHIEAMKRAHTSEIFLLLFSVIDDYPSTALFLLLFSVIALLWLQKNLATTGDSCKARLASEGGIAIEGNALWSMLPMQCTLAMLPLHNA